MNDIKTKRALDRALISLGSGDADSLEAVYELSARRLYSVCYLITGNREDAEDALHNAMLRICRYAPDYKSQNGAWAYLFTIARHAALDIVDRRKKFDPVENTDLCGLSSHAHETNPEAEAISQAAAAAMLGRLSDEERQTVALRLYADLTNSETAKVTGVSPACAQKRYRRALKKLKLIYMADIGQ